MPRARFDSVERVGEDQQQRENLYRVVIVALVAVLIASWVAVVWLVQGKNSAEDERDAAKDKVASYAAGPDAQDDAEEALAVMTTYDYRETKDLADRWTRYLGNSELKKQYEDELIPNLVKAVKLTKTVAVGEVESSAYSLVDDDHVNVLAFVRQTIKTKDAPKGVLDAEWFSLAMVRDGDSDNWLIDEVRPYDVPPPRD